MKRLITFALFGLILSTTAIAGEQSTLRVVRVLTDDIGAYVAQLHEGSQLINKVDSKFTLRAWQATFAGEATGTVVVAVEYPGRFSDFAKAWDKIQADKAVAGWIEGLSGSRKIVSDTLYKELAI